MRCVLVQKLQDSIFDVIRGDDASYVPAIAGVPVKSVRDLGTGFDSGQPGAKILCCMIQDVSSYLTYVCRGHEWKTTKLCYRPKA